MQVLEFLLVMHLLIISVIVMIHVVHDGTTVLENCLQGLFIVVSGSVFNVSEALLHNSKRTLYILPQALYPFGPAFLIGSIHLVLVGRDELLPFVIAPITN